MAATYTPIPIITPIKAASFTPPPAANLLDFVETASGGPVAGDQLGDAIPLNGPLLVLLHNTDVGSQNVSLLSAADTYGRFGDITTYACGAGLRSAFYARQEGWLQTDGTLYAIAAAVAVKYAAFALPAVLGRPWRATSGVAGSRVAINPISALGPWADPNVAGWTPTLGQPAALALDFVLTAMSASVGNNIAMNGPLLLIFTNSNAAAKTVTISSVPDGSGRTGDITYSIAQNILSALYIRPQDFRQPDGNLYLIANSTNVSVAAFALPG